MRLPAPHFHTAVTASLVIWLAGAGFVQAQSPEPMVPAVPAIPKNLPDPPSSDLMPDLPFPGPEGEAEGEAVTPEPEPAAPTEPTAEARIRDAEDLDMLFAELAQEGGEGWARAESDILRVWSRSGSAAMDLLYKRGEAALDAGDLPTAIGHLTALTDHAPDFASGWHLRAVAFYLDGDFGPAMADLARALQLEPRYFPALTQLAVMLEEVGEDQRALEAYRASLKIHPHQQDAQDGVTRLQQKTQGTDA